MLDIRNCDNMDLMREFPDKYFDLAIVDPPYGLKFDTTFNRTNKDHNGARVKANKYKSSDWDSQIPSDNYFNELFRVSKNQIIWGGNYFPYLWKFGCKGFIFWHKQNPVQNFADGEMAWTSFNRVAKQFQFKYFGNVQGNTKSDNRIHPTQKPHELYRWLLENYGAKGNKILDTHLGSGSIAIACYDYGFDLTACEIDKDYYEASMKRINAHVAQQKIFSHGSR